MGIGLDIVGLYRALRLLLSPVCIVAVMTGAIAGAVYWRYVQNPSYTQLFRLLSTDHFLVLEQLRRVNEAPLPDTAFFGDSSCLMGIVVPIIRESFGNTSIESYCSIAFLGPAGYAAMLNKLVDRNARPKKLIIALHPIQFMRHASWDQWLLTVTEGKMYGGQDHGFPISALDYARFEWLAPILYRPLPGPFGRFFGSAAQFIANVRANLGSTIDPATGLEAASLEEFEARHVHVHAHPKAGEFPFQTNDLFMASLVPLREAIARSGAKTYLVITPIADASFGQQSGAQLALIQKAIADRLGIPHDHILAGPAHMPGRYFSGQTHLNRWGRIVYTRRLAEIMRLAPE